MTDETDADDLLAFHGWERLHDTVAEGCATRTEVKCETGDVALLYVWSDESAARRASMAHEIAGQELFAVPERLDSGPGWLLVRKPDGVPLATLLPDGDTTRLTELGDRARELITGLGNVVRKLHEIPGDPACGDLLDDDPDKHQRWLTFSGYVAHELEWLGEHLRRRSWSEEVLSRLTTSIADVRHELSAFHPRNPSCICHGRLSLQHVWVDDAGREIVGLTGFEGAALLPREADVAFLLWLDGIGADEQLARAFYRGYGAARTMDVQRRERFYRRLVSFQALFGAKGEVHVSEERLIELTSSLSIA